MKKIELNHKRMRASFFSAETAEPRFGEADKENGVLKGVQITLEGEAKGHGVFLDREFCEQVVEAGNATGEAGVKVRFGHPAMCSDAIGTYLGRAKNFRIAEFTRKESGEKASGVIADVYLDKNADRYDWIMNMSESAPDTFGMSIVFTYSDFVVKDGEGVRHSYLAEVQNGDKTEKAWKEQSVDGREYAVLAKLLGSDFTDTPAATDGVFADETLAAKAAEMLEENPQIKEVILKAPSNVVEFLKRSDLFDGLAGAIESKRVKELQAAKDKEIAQLKETISMLESAIAEEKALKAANEEIYQLKSVNETLTKDLESAKADAERLSGELVTAKQSLAECRDQLAAWESHASAHGAHVNTPPSKGSFSGGMTRKEALAKLSSMPFAEREKFYAENRELIDGNK